MAWHTSNNQNNGFEPTDTSWQVGSFVTAMIWIKLETTALGTIFRKNPGSGAPRFNMDMSVSGPKVQFGSNANGGFANKVHSAVLSVGPWYCLIGRRGNNEQGISINGDIQIGTDAFGTMNDGPVVMGVIASDAGGSAGAIFHGWAAEFAVWDAYLSDDQLAGLSRGASPVTIRRDVLKMYSPMYGTPAPLLDVSGTGRHLNRIGTDAAMIAEPTIHPPVARPYGFSTA